jgi:hypothetical protein
MILGWFFSDKVSYRKELFLITIKKKNSCFFFMVIRLFGNVPPFGKKPQGRYQLQNWKNPRKWNVLHAAIWYLPEACKRNVDIFMSCCQMFSATSFVPFAYGIRELHETHIMFCNIPLREIKSKYKNGATFKIHEHIRDSYTHQSLSIHATFRPIKIWCDYTFKGLFSGSYSVCKSWNTFVQIK